MSTRQVKRLIKAFKEEGAEEFFRQKNIGNHRNLSFEEEAEIRATCQAESQKGQLITAKVIRQRLEENLGRQTRSGYVYDVLKRHKWNKFKPRSQHPKKASDEDIQASKKLTLKVKK